MRIAALYDIHANLHALDAVLAEVDAVRPDSILIGGDVALGPMPAETLARLAERGDRVRFIRGNCDREIAAALETPLDETNIWKVRTHWCAERLDASQRELLSRLSETAILDVDELGPVLFCHGSPRSDEEIITHITSAARMNEMLASVEQKLVVCGHTHVQFDRSIAGKRVVNAGSVGMPYEDSPGARWALLGPRVRLMRTAYDVAAAAEEIRKSGFPQADEFVRKFLLDPPKAREATEFFENAAGSRA